MDVKPSEPALLGRWRVERVSGLLPPAGIGKVIGPKVGATTVLGLPAARFTVHGHTLRYRRLPVCDDLTRAADGTWRGRGTLFGLTFCHFRLVRR